MRNHEFLRIYDSSGDRYRDIIIYHNEKRTDYIWVAKTVDGRVPSYVHTGCSKNEVIGAITERIQDEFEDYTIQKLYKEHLKALENSSEA